MSNTKSLRRKSGDDHESGKKNVLEVVGRSASDLILIVLRLIDCKRLMRLLALEFESKN